MRDLDVRQALYAKVLADHVRDPRTLVIPELGIWSGGARVDIAVVNGRLHGFEIKSDTDTLKRLPAQREVYNSVFDRVTIVCGSRHTDHLSDQIPDWWGLKIATLGQRGAVHFEDVRQPKKNPCIDPVSLAGMLWRDEALRILQQRGVKGIRSKRRLDLCKVLASHLEIDDLRDCVRAALKSRAGWRSDLQSTPRDDSLPLFSK